MNAATERTALLSVSNKTGLVEFAKQLSACGFRLLSTGGSAQLLLDNDIAVTKVSDVTDFPEIMGGRVKTLHPRIHGGILGRRDQDAAEAAAHNIGWIDLVVCNLYPFAETIKNPDTQLATALENIDIGGPCMIRAAAKNFPWVSVITDPNDYAEVLAQINQHGFPEDAMRKRLAAKAFAHTAYYDSLITDYLTEDDFPEQITFAYHKKQELRYGENPHQPACLYQSEQAQGLLSAEQLQGKPLSFNNLIDADAALNCCQEFSEPACVVIKHATPCGVAVADDIDHAFQRAIQADQTSAFGGIIALNQPCTEKIASFLTEFFAEVVIAPEFSAEALNLLNNKKNLRLLKLADIKATASKWDLKSIQGGLLMQASDAQQLLPYALDTVTKAQVDDAQLQDLCFAWQVVKHVKSNAILIARDRRTLGIGPGQVSRVGAVEIALNKAGDRCQGAVLASDAFFPFRDSIDTLAGVGIKAIIQPGGSVRDEEVIAACDEHGIAMVFTGSRCFKH